MNLHSIQIGLRQFLPDLALPDFGLDIKKGAKNFIEVTSKAIDMPYYGMRMYSSKTLATVTVQEFYHSQYEANK